MPVLEVLRVLALAAAMSAVAPTVLIAAGVVDVDLLLVVFLPGVCVGATTAWYSRRRLQRSAASPGRRSIATR